MLSCISFSPLAPQFPQATNPVSSTSLMSPIPYTPPSSGTYPYSCGWWYLACLTVSSLAASPVSSFYLCYPQTFMSDHVLSWSAPTPLCSLSCCFLWCCDQTHLSLLLTPVLCSSSSGLLIVPLTSSSSPMYMTLYILLLHPNWAHPHPYHRFFVCLCLYPCGCFHVAGKL